MDGSPEASLIVFCWGNASRGDDGIGPLLAQRLRDLAVDGLVVVEDHQLNIEHVTDFEGMTPVLFIDASVAIELGCRLIRIEPSEDGNFSTHAISPQALLNVYRQATGLTPPPAFLMHIAGRDFALGADLSDTAADAIKAALAALEEIFARPKIQWVEYLERGLSCATPSQP
jgi:hydrogenase maturation protease